MPRSKTIASLVRQIEAHPKDAELHQELGLLYRKKGLMDESKAAYERSLELDPCDPWTHLYLGNWHYTLDQYEDAIECWNYAARLLPDKAIPFCCLGDAYNALGHEKTAAENYQRALEIEPDDDTAKKRWRRWQKNHEPEG